MIKDNETLYIVIPAYNESENIKSVVEDWYPVIEKYNGDGKSRLVIIDDGSKDDTYQIMKELAKTRPLFEPVTKINGGHGATVLFGYKYALENGADYVFQTDSDGQTLSSEFDAFWDLKNNYDMVIGDRTNREDGLSRWFVTKVLKLVVRICFGVSIADANTPFRLMEANVLQEQIKYVPKDYNLTNVLLSVLYKKNNLKMKFIPITFRPRQGGVNSINMVRIIGIGKQALKDFVELRKRIESLS